MGYFVTRSYLLRKIIGIAFVLFAAGAIAFYYRQFWGIHGVGFHQWFWSQPSLSQFVNSLSRIRSDFSLITSRPGLEAAKLHLMSIVGVLIVLVSAQTTGDAVLWSLKRLLPAVRIETFRDRLLFPFSSSVLAGWQLSF